MFKENLSGQKFGKLVALEYKGKSHWLCRCDCGNMTIVSTNHLKTGHTKSCGCYRSALCSERASVIRKHGDTPNEHKIEGDVCYIYLSNCDIPVVIDSDDYSIVSKYRWHKTLNGYVRCNKNGNHLCIHQMIIGDVPNGLEIDHVNCNKFDNRRCNLRVVNRIENSRNKKRISANTSGCTGVSFDKYRNKWAAYIVVNYKTIHLGRYDNIEDAIKARKDAEQKYFGQYAYVGD